MELETPRLKLVLETREDVERMLEAMPAEERSQVSADWLARMRAAREPDPWSFTFRIVGRETGSAVGTGGFKGPPLDGVVEIAYAIRADHEGNGYATEAARALVRFALDSGLVRVVRAHTLPGGAASKQVLAKCGFRHVGEFIDPEDGTVSRFERAA